VSLCADAWVWLQKSLTPTLQDASCLAVPLTRLSSCQAAEIVENISAFVVPFGPGLSRTPLEKAEINSHSAGVMLCEGKAT